MLIESEEVFTTRRSLTRAMNNLKAAEERAVAVSSSHPSQLTQTNAPNSAQSHSWRGNSLKSTPNQMVNTRRYHTRSKQKKAPHSTYRSDQQERVMTQPPPKPTKRYSESADAEPKPLKTPQQLLIIVDLNGTLILRDRRTLTEFRPRPGLESFLEHAFGNHRVMVWTSMRPQNMNIVLRGVFTEAQQTALLAAWARDSLGLSRWEYNNKVQVYKRLHKIWNDNTINPRLEDGTRRWHQGNTVLIDDSILKASSQPFNLINIPEFERESKSEQQSGFLMQVTSYLREVASWSDISAYIKRHPFQTIAPTAASLPSFTGELGERPAPSQTQPPGLDGAFNDLSINDPVR